VTDSEFHGSPVPREAHPAARRPLWSRVTARCAVLAVAVAIAYPLIGYVAMIRFGEKAWLSAAVAAAVCWLGAALALALTAWFQGPQGALYALLFGMFCRMGLPLIVGIALANQGGVLADAGVFGCILAFYLVTLVGETLLVLPLIPRKLSAVKAL
jgi:hypothetical protein